MPRADYTDITLVLDRSGSMNTVKDATIEAFNGFLTTQRAGEGFATVSLVQFDDQYEVVFPARPVLLAPELTPQTYQPRGSTALLDAMGRTILETAARIAAMPEEARPGSVLFATLTDGFENASREFTMARINELIADHRDRLGWQFIFLAANQDAIATAAGMGIGPQAALSFAASPMGAAECFRALGDKMNVHRKARAAGLTKAIFEFDEGDRAAAVGKEKKS